METHLPYTTKNQPLATASVIPQINMSENEFPFSAALFAALGNPPRLRIPELLTHGECTVNEVAQTLEIHQPNASLNLTTLLRAGIVKVTRKGVQRYYSLRGPRIAQILLLANQFRSVHAGAIDSDTSVAGDELPATDDKGEQTVDDLEQAGGAT